MRAALLVSALLFLIAAVSFLFKSHRAPEPILGSRTHEEVNHGLVKRRMGNFPRQTSDDPLGARGQRRLEPMVNACRCLPWLLVLLPRGAIAEPPPQYFPLDLGNRWTYVTKGGSAELQVAVVGFEGQRMRVDFHGTEVNLLEEAD